MKIFVLNAKKAFVKISLFTGVLVLLICSIVFKEQMVEVFTASSEQLPIYCVDTTEKKVAMSFDCAWGAEDIEQILTALEKEKVKTTFFLVGSWMSKFPVQAKNIAAAGHDIGNHSDSHLHMSGISSSKATQEIAATNAKIEKLTGKKCTLFRAPYGDYDENLVRIARNNGQYTIQWDVDSLDWKNLSADSICERVMGKVKNGSIILLHSGTENTKTALPKLIAQLKKAGYKIVPVSELIIKDNYYIDYKGAQHSK